MEALRWLLGNVDGVFLAATVVHLGGISSPLHAEAAMFAQQWSTEQVEMEGDALMVISAIQNRVATHYGPFGHLFDDTRHITEVHTMENFLWPMRSE